MRSRRESAQCRYQRASATTTFPSRTTQQPHDRHAGRQAGSSARACPRESGRLLVPSRERERESERETEALVQKSGSLSGECTQRNVYHLSQAVRLQAKERRERLEQRGCKGGDGVNDDIGYDSSTLAAERAQRTEARESAAARDSGDEAVTVVQQLQPLPCWPVRSSRPCLPCVLIT